MSFFSCKTNLGNTISTNHSPGKSDFGRLAARKILATAFVLFATLTVMLTGAPSARAVVFTLGGPTPGGAGVDMDTTSALYASGRDGAQQLIAQVGGITPDGGVFNDLGVPSISPEGAVVFGAESIGQDDQPRWDIYRADPGAPPTRRIIRVLSSATIPEKCRPVFKTDPYPIAGENGSIAFLAPEASGQDAVFRYDDGKLTCVARIGDRTAEGHTIKMLYFGSADIGANGQLAFLARIAGAGDRGADHAAVVVSNRNSPIREIAVASNPAPEGGQFGPTFGRPAISRSHYGNIIAFTNRHGAADTAYLSRAGHLSKSFGTGTPTRLGALTYLSDGRPGLLPDGSLIVSGACRSKNAVFMAKDGELTPIKRQGDRTQFGTRLVAFVDPSVTASGLVFLGGHDDTGIERLFIFESREAAPAPLESDLDLSKTGRWMPPFFPGSLAVNQRGDLAFLGASGSPDPVKTRIVQIDRF